MFAFGASKWVHVEIDRKPGDDGQETHSARGTCFFFSALLGGSFSIIFGEDLRGIWENPWRISEAFGDASTVQLA